MFPLAEFMVCTFVSLQGKQIKVAKTALRLEDVLGWM
jgi:hypothetical protein